MMMIESIRYNHLEGLEWVDGTRDCFEIVRDFFQDNFSISITNYARPAAWWDNGLNLYMDHFGSEGFHVVDNPRPIDIQIGDVFLCAIRSDVANHAAIYIGNGNILHHFIGRRSNVELYKGLWKNTTVATVRHQDLNDLRVRSGSYNILDDPRISEKFRNAV